jgi:hypothetical protein
MGRRTPAHMENCHGPLPQGEDISSNFKHQTEEKLEKGDNYHLPTTLRFMIRGIMTVYRYKPMTLIISLVGRAINPPQPALLQQRRTR